MEDHGDYIEPEQYPTGIDYVFINGKLVIDQGQHIGVRAGVVLRKPRLK